MQQRYRHEALPYSDHAEFVSCCQSIAESSRDHGERLIFLVAAVKLSDVRDVVDRGGDDIAFVSADEHGRNPARITTLLDTFQAGSGGRPCVGVNEPVFGRRSPAALDEARLGESLLNTVRLRSWPLSVLCLYDVGELTADELLLMRRNHPAVRGLDENPAYDPDLASELFRSRLAAPRPPVVKRNVHGGSDLAAARAFVRAFARDHDVLPDRREDLVLAAHEVITNSIRHGGGECRLSMWVDGAVVCEARDAGVIRDPLVGRLAPVPTAPTGRGLWLANQLCDLVQIRSSQAGTVVRLHVER
jgi:anti-sigma regulatory factor (Ser/Thr protein kinase)